MAQEPIEVSRLAEQIWRMITTGSPNSQPHKREVELAVQEAAAYWGTREMYDKYKMEAQWVTNQGYIVPFWDVVLEAYPGDDFSKIAKFPVKPLDLPKDRGLDRVTYTEVIKGKRHQRTMGKLTPYQREHPGGLFRTLAHDYFYTHEADYVIVSAKCNDEPVDILKVNLFPIIITSANMSDALKYIVISEVTKQYRGYSPKDEAADQNQKV